MVEKKRNMVSKIQARLSQGWKDVEKLAEDTGAKVSTVKTQMYKFYKANPDKKPVKPAKPVKE